MSGVEFRNVVKVFDDDTGGVIAVDDVSIDVEDGEFLVLVGPSGSGKSTTLRMLAGLESMTSGEIVLDGELINDMPPRKRDIALVFQNNALYPHKTVRENMAYGLKVRTDLSDDVIDQRVEETAEMMGIEDLLDKKPGALSGGQQQRVATGRAIVREPAVFLFDEPLSDLDANLRKHMRTEIARLHSKLGITTIYVTHDQEEAMTLADRIVILNHGEVQQIGTPIEVYYNPANVFVADFIGSPNINLFDVTLERTDDGGIIHHDLFDYPVSRSFVDAIDEEAGESGFVLGVRPEDITVAETGDTAFSATVEVVETVGSDNFLYVRLGDEECRVRVPATVLPKEGEAVPLWFDEDHIYLFDKATGDAAIDRTTYAEEDFKPVL